MSVETKLYIDRLWSIEDVKDVIEKRFNVPVKYEFHEWAPDYITLSFKPRGYDVIRQMGVHTKSAIGGFPAIMLSLGANTEGVEILRTLAKTLGGLFQEEDTGGAFEEYPKPGEGNIDFIIKEGIKSDPSLGSDDEGMAEYISQKKWSNKNVWPKPLRFKK